MVWTWGRPVTYNLGSVIKGANNIKKYWSRYYQGSQGVIFVLDSASSEGDMEVARKELHAALQHPQLSPLPFLILANHQDKPAARSPQEVTFHTKYRGRLFSFGAHSTGKHLSKGYLAWSVISFSGVYLRVGKVSFSVDGSLRYVWSLLTLKCRSSAGRISVCYKGCKHAGPDGCLFSTRLRNP